MDNTLKEIIKNKGEEITQSRSNKDLFQKIFEKKTASIIGEVKIASPSYDYSELIEYTEIIDAYLEATNIKAISILIDKKFFQ
jgi:indole-3-glycerol phosphate synthase